MMRSIQLAFVSMAAACCLAGGCPDRTPNGADSDRLVIFHNGSGSMCVQALQWLEEVEPAHPDLIIEEHLTTDPAGVALLLQMRSQYAGSQGVSASFEFLPIIFYGEHAFSGFNQEIADTLEGLIASQAN